MRHEEKCANCKVGVAIEKCSSHMVNFGNIAISLSDIRYMKCYDCGDSYFTARQAREARMAYEYKIGKVT